MKTVIRFRDDQGNIIGTIREEKLSSPIRVLSQFSVAMFILDLLLSWLL
ncbi:hypothetical protein [Paenibacillus sp. NPDC057934]